MIIHFETKGTAYHDLNGIFPHKSSRGNEYILVNYDHDRNSILAEPLKINKLLKPNVLGLNFMNNSISKAMLPRPIF